MIERSCQRCDATFRCWPSHKKKFCSPTCRYAAARVRFLPTGWHFYDGHWWYHWTARGKTWRKQGIERACEHCGKAFPARAYRGLSRYRFCSHRCSTLSNVLSPGTVRANGPYLDEYVTPDDPYFPMRQGRAFRVLQHRLVMARHLGRLLAPHEQVHHINGDRQDNRLENLQLRDGHHGDGRVARCADCGSQHIVYEAL